MLEFLFRLVVETTKFAFRVLAVLAGFLLPAVGNAAHAFFRQETEPEEEVTIASVQDAEWAYAAGKISAESLYTYQQMYGR